MKKVLSYLAALVSVSCVHLGESNPFSSSLRTISVQLEYPEGYESSAREGVKVSFEEINNLTGYTVGTNSNALAEARIPCGLYRIKVSDRFEDNFFNGTIDKVSLSADRNLTLALSQSKTGTLIIKEIYCGGCPKTPADGKYQYDKYVLIHNNSPEVMYLDSLCFCTLYPYNATGTNKFTGIPDFAPVKQALWQIGGDGHTFPLNPGEDATICINGAVDHTKTYPLSVNLNKEQYFVCYNPVAFDNTSYHPVPGDQIRNNHILNLVEKLGEGNAFAFSMESPTVVIFKTKGIPVEEYIRMEGITIFEPGSTKERLVKLPWEWIMDGVEVFFSGRSGNQKRIRSDVDAGSIFLSATGLGRSLVRHIDQEESEKLGYEVLVDTNNSTEDFYERETALLHE